MIKASTTRKNIVPVSIMLRVKRVKMFRYTTAGTPIISSRKKLINPLESSGLYSKVGLVKGYLHLARVAVLGDEIALATL